ncbi:MAG: 4Fe-4S binding protein [Candidatus Bathyarchaeota archaeon]|nr:4Fe-4S binding protein [Candidatus Bathyarchaeota archaeon]
MDTHRQHVSIDLTKCAPCPGLVCVGVCPQGVLEEGKDKKPQVGDASACTQCGVCADLCPTKAITVTSAKGSIRQ